MHCPVCSHPDTRVVDSRVVTGGHGIRRRRTCGECDFRFSTTEDVEILDLAVVKRDGRREPYRREKLESGLKKAFEKRPFGEEGLRAIRTAIECDIQKLRKAVVTSDEIGEVVMRHLKDADTVAYIRFASVYRSFEDVESFRDELAQLSGRKRNPRKTAVAAE